MVPISLPMKRCLESSFPFHLNILRIFQVLNKVSIQHDEKVCRDPYPRMDITLAVDSFTSACANTVFPQPVGPYKSRPAGGLMPSFVNI
jgi:hypothetical protein